MADRPPAVRRLDMHLAAAMLAHERIADLHQRAGATDRSAGLMRESAAVVLVELPAVLHHAVEVRRLWAERELLDPAAAARTAAELDLLLDRVKPSVDRLLRRQRQIFEELRGRSGDG